MKCDPSCEAPNIRLGLGMVHSDADEKDLWMTVHLLYTMYYHHPPSLSMDLICDDVLEPWCKVCLTLLLFHSMSMREGG